MEKNSKEISYLSASKIKTLSDCSWSYYCSYVLKLPDSSNSGAKRGTAVHDLLECLCHERHKHYIDVLKQHDSPDEIKSIKRFFIRKFKQLELDPNEEVKKVKGEPGGLTNWTLVMRMMMNALKHEFFEHKEEAKEILHSEYAFNHVEKNPTYAVRGFIDRVASYEENGEKVLEILDYKSSKAKFSGDEKENNLQAMIYTLMARKKWTDFDRYVANFLFLRFEDPYQKNEFSKEQLDGLEHYLEYVYGIVNNFTEEDALSNLAANKKEKSWLCGRGSWICPHRHPKMFFSVVGKEGKQLASFSSYEEAEVGIKKIKGGEQIELKNYGGCPAWNKKYLT
jgi:ATP-dependent helicase/DNAse subunit B